MECAAFWVGIGITGAVLLLCRVGGWIPRIEYRVGCVAGGVDRVDMHVTAREVDSRGCLRSALFSTDKNSLNKNTLCNELETPSQRGEQFMVSSENVSTNIPERTAIPTRPRLAQIALFHTRPAPPIFFLLSEKIPQRS